MKKTFFLVALVVLTGCKTWDGSMINPKKDPISPKLLTLERKIEDLMNTNVVTNYDEVKLFTKEVEDNLTDPYGDKYGYIALKRNIIEARIGVFDYLFSTFLLTAPNLLGMPFMNIRYKVEVEIRIMDRENRLIGKYSAIGKSSVKVAYYYGYSMRNAFRKAYPDALIDAFDKIRPQIQADAQRVNEKLKATGIIKQ
ncbi:MAG: hypothetical protein K2Q03_01905 [Sphingobacteriaceae bacterium]|nr:hypothetical protein [Sphingobacteriaceae bacterium]